MKKLLKVTACALLAMVPADAILAQTLEECQQAAERNYPLVKKFAMLSRMTDYTVSNIQKGWLPQLTASAQATYQSDVASWPSAFSTLMQQVGVEPAGLRKDQYKIGIDVQQTVYDGGTIHSQKAIARSQGDVGQAQNAVELYAVRKRVNELYFGLLLLHDKKQLNEDLQYLLAENERKLSSMFQHGTAAECDYQLVKAEHLAAVQQMTLLQSQERAFRQMLSHLCGMEVNQVSKPPVVVSTGENNRPELKLIHQQLKLVQAQRKALDSQLRPRLSIFASGYYGYPGLNMFDDMMKHQWSLNGMVGARLTWNIGALYTRKADKAQLDTQCSLYELQREQFLFNTTLEQIQQDENIENFRRLMADDDEIIRLRSAVRKSSESKLSHGVIDASELVRQITQENNAKTQRSLHEIEMLREIYHRKYTIDNSYSQ